ncbi:3-oxoacyl-ACP reductase FabG [Helicobacter saguini]|uniref:3-oxoacyl-[acyl-carrier-protein] reductase n=1 Tax=Helicobacter saguini TaxID=1548018 RepID=A0A347VT17_9HELI|nr:3-oxoacyl-ACP reductase FabG [Helicobacter saguini]MWV62274.1 3-oxoacyl-ACP reductase FabG [Helicobacter saguini]MWV67053.1 3-oxoacyl-ACP reductase FabG [Helicobacter saguini]MWV69403.1 3-oxoacyl-ACP reductase FabG [Helicobacter saguini]MWV71043.1 3-oxoacyl-ACP reductase FabG [Helicobacter saguini]TLD95051.1 3-oxoacyl-ACP reductase FabG [Helicobacter saguini]
MKFSGKNVLITGASRGIGSEIAKVLASFGLKVWINYRSNPDSANALKDSIESSGGKAAVIAFDAAHEEAFKTAIELIKDSDGELSYLVNNAGITNDKLALRMSVEDFMQVIDSNLKSCFIGCREALKVMSKQRFGSVVNISSIVGEKGNAGQVNYSASKGGMLALTKSFALESGLRGVRFNCITPGFIETDMTAGLKEEVKNEYVKNIPLGRFGTTSDIAYGVAFLLSDYAAYITGETLRINGGLYV